MPLPRRDQHGHFLPRRFLWSRVRGPIAVAVFIWALFIGGLGIYDAGYEAAPGGVVLTPMRTVVVVKTIPDRTAYRRGWDGAISAFVRETRLGHPWDIDGLESTYDP